ncbi:MAG: hypothetical protein ACXVQV_12690 [Actinomycetota bacterium]
MPTVTDEQRRLTVLVIGITLVASGLFLIGRLAFWGRDASGLADVGRQFTTGAPLPEGLTVRRNVGFDGQFFYRLALNPATTSREQYGLRLDQPARRQQRILYPVLAWIASGGGRARAVPWALIAINIVAYGCVAWAGVVLARSSGRAPPAGLLFAATPGLLIALGFDTTEVVATALAMFTLILLRQGRFGWATAVSTLAVLARETTLVIAIGILIAIVWKWRTKDRYSIDGRRVPLVVGLVPIVVYAVWQVVLWARWGKPAFTSTDGSDLGAPIVGLVRAARMWADRGQLVDNTFFLAATVVVIVLGIASLRRSDAHLHEKGALIAAGLLALLYQWTVLVHYATFLRGLSEAYVLAILMLLGDHRRNVLPVGLAWIEVWAYLAVRARVIG